MNLQQFNETLIKHMSSLGEGLWIIYLGNSKDHKPFQIYKSYIRPWIFSKKNSVIINTDITLLCFHNPRHLIKNFFVNLNYFEQLPIQPSDQLNFSFLIWTVVALDFVITGIKVRNIKWYVLPVPIRNEHILKQIFLPLHLYFIWSK